MVNRVSLEDRIGAMLQHQRQQLQAVMRGEMCMNCFQREGREQRLQLLREVEQGWITYITGQDQAPKAGGAA